MCDVSLLAPGQLLPVNERKRVLSATRLKFTLTIFVVTILRALSAMIFVGVSRIFDWLTPSIRADLQHKAQRGVDRFCSPVASAVCSRLGCVCCL
jgi:hypothetical protein